MVHEHLFWEAPNCNIPFSKSKYRQNYKIFIIKATINYHKIGHGGLQHRLEARGSGKQAIIFTIVWKTEYFYQY